MPASDFVRVRFTKSIRMLKVNYNSRSDFCNACLASIRSLLRYLRNEGSDCDVRLELGRLRIVSSDLIPLLRSCGENKTLMELVIRLLMNLTQPAIVCFRQEVPKDRDLYGTYVQLDDLLKSFKKVSKF